jgi:hypothetical protein
MLERIAKLNSEIEAQRLEAELKARNIPCLLRSYHDSAYDGLFQFAHGWGHIEAASEHRQEVLTLLEEIRQECPGPEEAFPREHDA